MTLTLTFCAVAIGITGMPLGQISAEQVVRDSSQLLSSAKTISGVFYVASDSSAAEKVEFNLAKPNKLSLVSVKKEDYFDGVNHSIVYPDKHQFETRDFRLTGLPYLIGFEAFVTQADGKPWPNLPQYGNAVVAQLDGTDVVKSGYSDGTESVTVYIDAQSKLPRGWDWMSGGHKSIIRIKSIEIDKALPLDAFSYRASSGFEQIPSTDTRALLAVGATVPDFRDTNGKRFFEVTKGNKATILAFFNPKYVPSTDILKPLEAVAKSYGSKNVGVVLASVGMKNSDIDRALKLHGGLKLPTFNLGMSREPTAAAYGVTVFPSVYLLDAEGKVVLRQIGFDRVVFERALAGLGL